MASDSFDIICVVYIINFLISYRPLLKKTLIQLWHDENQFGPISTCIDYEVIICDIMSRGSPTRQKTTVTLIYLPPSYLAKVPFSPHLVPEFIIVHRTSLNLVPWQTLYGSNLPRRKFVKVLFSVKVLGTIRFMPKCVQATGVLSYLTPEQKASPSLLHVLWSPLLTSEKQLSL